VKRLEPSDRTHFRFLACAFPAAGTAGFSPPPPTDCRALGRPADASGRPGNHLWFASGSWEWMRRDGTLLEGQWHGQLTTPGPLHRLGASARQRGQVRAPALRLRSCNGRPPLVELPPALRRVTVGQTGSIWPGVIQTWRAPVAVAHGRAAGARRNKSATVALGGQNLFTAGACRAPGLVGLARPGTPDFDGAFADPWRALSQCAGQADQPRRDVYVYWDGSGGTGTGRTPRSKATGIGGRRWLPAQTVATDETAHPKHRNGIRRAQSIVNSYARVYRCRTATSWMLRSPSAYCTTACHPAAARPPEPRSDADPAVGAVHSARSTIWATPSRADGKASRTRRQRHHAA
jgi:hypothetical protein